MMLGPAALGNTGTAATTGAKKARQEWAEAPADWRQQVSREYSTVVWASQRLKETGQPLLRGKRLAS